MTTRDRPHYGSPVGPLPLDAQFLALSRISWIQTCREPPQT
jgi:hypothetical protein